MTQQSLFDVGEAIPAPIKPYTVSDRKFVPRDYQLEAIDATEKALGLGAYVGQRQRSATIISLATGLGKTEVAVELARKNLSQVGRMLWVVHTQDLVRQAAKTIALRTGIEPAIEMGRERSNETYSRSPIVVATPQSLHESRLSRFRDIGLLYFDEGHHAKEENKTYSSIRDHVFNVNPEAVLVGLSATIDWDDADLAKMYGHCSYDLGIARATQLGWLVGAVVNCCRIKSLSLKGVRTVGGEFDQKEMAKRLEAEKTLHEVAATSVEEGADKLKTLVFCSSVDMAEALASTFRASYGVKADWVCGDLKRCSKDRRAYVLESFKQGETTCLINVAVLTEGWDAPGLIDPKTGEVIDPGVEHIVMARMTRSLSLYTQMFGRGTRPIPGTVDGIPDSTPDKRKAAIAASRKPILRVTDLVDNSADLRLVTAANVFADGTFSPQIVDRAKRMLSTRVSGMSVTEALEVSKRQQEREDAKRKLREEREAGREAVIAKSVYERFQVDPYSDAGKQFIASNQIVPATDKQVRFLKGKGFKGAEKLTKIEAMRVTAELKRKRRMADIQREFDSREQNRLASGGTIAPVENWTRSTILPTTSERTQQREQSTPAASDGRGDDPASLRGGRKSIDEINKILLGG